MANLLFSNNASALLAATIDDDDTTVQVAAGFGALFPSPGSGQFFYASLENADGDIEIVKVTARSGDNLTVSRAQENTTAQAWTLNVTRVELRLTAASMGELVQISGDSMNGDLDMNGNDIIDAVFTGSFSSFREGEIAGVPIRGATGITGNQILVPANGTSRPTAGGDDILTDGDDLIAIMTVGGVLSLDPATRVEVNDAVFRVQGSSSNYRIDISTDDTDFNFTFTNITDVNWSGANLSMSDDIKMNDNFISGAVLQDFAVDHQSKTATATTEIDYTLGSYVKLALNASITTLTLSNPPDSNSVGTLRLKITQGGGGSKTITWPASVKWPGGVAPTLSTAVSAIDYVDLWTDNGGTTWYGAYNANWS